MLSICIPVFNYDIRKLVMEIHKQVSALDIAFELLVYDDCSSSNSIVTNNSEIQELQNVRFKVLENNIGRSAIRNLLADDSQFPHILFLDADVYPNSPDFIEKYFKHISAATTIIYGGIQYQKNKPAADEMLRWVYGREREVLTVKERLLKPHLRFLTLNFLISREAFNLLRFNENIPNLRHDDTLFALSAKNLGIPVLHIDNTVEHQGLESSKIFLKKSSESSQVLAHLVKSGLIEAKSTKLSKTAGRLLRYKLATFIISLQKTFRNRMEANLKSSQPSMILFDFHRLGEYLKSFISVR
ncbi:glycosyltransferase family 2 protein [Nonlabens antarcticus]|uniref:glycosyltransferase family 2 protein n=1 Tax=Nonlabens antarcticus TaxID=392714 RepID=UPI0018916E7C|nr:glycosyltransferase [Nonlabens antarcticus]